MFRIELKAVRLNIKSLGNQIPVISPIVEWVNKECGLNTPIQRHYKHFIHHHIKFVRKLYFRRQQKSIHFLYNV